MPDPLAGLPTLARDVLAAHFGLPERAATPQGDPLSGAVNPEILQKPGACFVTLTRDGDQPWRQQITTSLLRPLTRADLASALPAAGFEHIEWFGGLGGEPFDAAASSNLVVLARKA